MWVVALHFYSSDIDMAASNLLWYASLGLPLSCLIQNMVLVAITAK